MAQASLQEIGVVGPAFADLVEVAAGPKATAGWHGDGTRYVPGQQGGARLRFRDAGDGREQGLGVGMGRALDDGLGRADLDDLAQVHDGDAVGDVGDNTDVV